MFTPQLLDLLLPLLAGHAVGDFVLQTDSMVANKRKFSVLAGHCLVVTLVTYVFVARWSVWQIPVAVFLGHALLDFLKTRAGRDGLRIFVLDQLGHVGVLAATAWFLYLEGGSSAWSQVIGPQMMPLWIVLTGFVFCVRAGGILVGYWVQPYLDEIRRAAEAERHDVRPPKSRGLTNGGRVIGQWERALIFIFVGLGQFGAIGFLVAAKSIFRFGELKDRENRMEAEYITIGTLMSFGWALVTAWFAWWLAR